ncbi:PREDICTED: probable 2-carboxy-D-arabinitol-1-phosphatase [Camelina sativa]|uniref:Probable 2-carboxy-D-arabinitol-1-phosphatase n=1 Tax=Camelina sativa TaxID=90675 RepID=A0ABM0VDF8_CAMSA|nr:PREDICTED: probable 2-carboxy-D-arabinitol-1-phosphatase [Camelina sativa]
MISLPLTSPISPNRSLLHQTRRPNSTRRRFWIRSSSSLQDQDTAKTPPKRVVLVRHGQSTWNEEGRIQGSSDFSVLTNKGESQADISRQMLAGDSFDVCFTSPLKRSKKTAEIIWGSRESEMIFNYELREIDLYSFQGLLKKEGKEKFGEAFREWQEDPANFSIDGHYPVRELWSRARSCWPGILAHDSKSVLVVAHNAINQALVATAIGLGTEYFRSLLQSNCGVSVLDFIPRADGGSPHVCLNRLNQTPNSPLSGGSSGGRKASKRIILVCHGQGDNEDSAVINQEATNDQPMNMLGVIQSQKIAEHLLDLRVSSIICSPDTASIETAGAISRVQEAAGCLGVDSVPRYVTTKQINELNVEIVLDKSNKDNDVIASIQPGWLSQLDEEAVSALWNRSGKAWESLLDELSDAESNSGDTMVVVGPPIAHISLIAQCLNLTKEGLGLFHLDAGSISVIDFPDGPSRKGVIRCTNYTAHLGRWCIPITRPA